MDVDGAQGPFTLRITTSGSGLRRWNIKVTQIECVNPSRAPPHCLQHMTGPSGTFWSFNYDWPTIRPLSSQSSVETESQEMSPGADDTGGYMNGLDYTICFRKEVGFCTQTYHVNTSHSPFELPNIDDQGRPTFDPSSAGAGAQRCLYDFVLLNSLRFCGSRLNLAGINKDVNVDHPVIGKH